LKSRHVKSRNAKWKHRKKRPLHLNKNRSRYRADRDWFLNGVRGLEREVAKRRMLAVMYGGRGYGKSYLGSALSIIYPSRPVSQYNAVDMRVTRDVKLQLEAYSAAMQKLMSSFAVSTTQLAHSFKVLGAQFMQSTERLDMTPPGESPDIAGTVSGYRVWAVNSRYGTSLRSIANNFFWQPGVNESKSCHDEYNFKAEPHPHPYCRCGFWGLYNPQHVPRYPRVDLTPEWQAMEDYPPELPVGRRRWVMGYVLGKIEGWGVVVEAQRGFRAQFAKITELWVWGADGAAEEEFTTALSRGFGIPVHRMSDDQVLHDIS
jgi:hypothetical protein